MLMNETNLARADLNLLALFEVIFSERHLGRTAARLNLTASAVSHGLSRLRRLLNDPLFLRVPKGVVPTARAMALADPIADVLARARNVLATASPFDPAKTQRRFVIGAPDGISPVFLTPLLARLQRTAPGIDIGLRQLLPPSGGQSLERAWIPALSELERGVMDIAVAPIDRPPPRFVSRMLYDEDFVVVARKRHPFAVKPSLQRFCEAKHIVVSMTADPRGFLDDELAKDKLARHVALTVADFGSALATAAGTDLIVAVPRRFAAMHAARFGVAIREVPLRTRTYSIRAVAPKAALMDAGLAWLFEELCAAVVPRT
jgi:DNA-binding transcriptional LysR family regulator